MQENTFNFFKNEKKIDDKMILITGGAGFIGSNFIRFMRNKYPNYKIINFDKLTYAGNLNNVSLMEDNPDYVFMKGDVANQKDVKNVFEEFNPDYVIHFAAESHVDRSILNPDVFLQTNIIGTQYLLNFSRLNNVKKFIFISTDEVYGSIDKDHCTEESPICPNNYYSVSKAAADNLVKVSYQTHGQRINIVRCCNNYGQFQFPEKFIPLMISKAINNKDLPIYGDGNYFRDWLHVDDNCRAIDLVLHKGRIGEIYNVGGNNEWRNIDLAEYLLELIGKPKSLLSYIMDRPSHDYRYAVNFNKIRSELCWHPLIDFKIGIKQTVDWYLSHQDWLNEIISGEYLKYYDLNYKNRDAQE